MAVNRKGLVFFERRFDRAAEGIQSTQEHVELAKLHHADPVDDNLRTWVLPRLVGTTA